MRLQTGLQEETQTWAARGLFLNLKLVTLRLHYPDSVSAHLKPAVTLQPLLRTPKDHQGQMSGSVLTKFQSQEYPGLPYIPRHAVGSPTVAKNPSANAGVTVQSLGRCHIPRAAKACAPQLLSPRAVIPEAWVSTAHALQQEKPPQLELPPLTTSRESLYSETETQCSQINKIPLIKHILASEPLKCKNICLRNEQIP